MYHPERFNETFGEIIRGVQQFTWEIYPYFLPHKPEEIFQGVPRVYRPRTFEGVYRHRHKLRRGEVIMPREMRLQQKYLDVLADFKEQEKTSTDGLNNFTRSIQKEIKEKGIVIDRNWYPHRIPHQKCMQFTVWYDSDIPIYQRAEYVATAVYTDGLDPEDVAIWMNIPGNKSIPSIGHVQLVVKRYPENWFTLFQHLPVHFMHQDIYSLKQPPNHVYPR